MFQGINIYFFGIGFQCIFIDIGEGKLVWFNFFRSILEQEKVIVDSVFIMYWYGDYVGGIVDFFKLVFGVSVYKNMFSDGMCDIVDGQVFLVEGVILIVLYMFGYMKDYMVFILVEEDVMFMVDNVFG